MNRPRDLVAPDGIFASGERIVRKGGKIKVARHVWQHDDLIPLVGQLVYVSNPDYWLTEISCFPLHDHYHPICTIAR